MLQVKKLQVGALLVSTFLRNIKKKEDICDLNQGQQIPGQNANYSLV